jgi:hypothetical protein
MKLYKPKSSIMSLQDCSAAYLRPIFFAANQALNKKNTRTYQKTIYKLK